MMPGATIFVHETIRIMDMCHYSSVGPLKLHSSRDRFHLSQKHVIHFLSPMVLNVV